jgi:CubicO group peptidase (beta-lactamase class C family)
MAADTICRTESMTKPIVAAYAMTLVEDCTLRLDDPVDEAKHHQSASRPASISAIF